jgi:hypothetical protein
VSERSQYRVNSVSHSVRSNVSNSVSSIVSHSVSKSFSTSVDRGLWLEDELEVVPYKEWEDFVRSERTS